MCLITSALSPESSPPSDSSATAPSATEQAPSAATDEVSAPAPAPSQGTSGSSEIIASVGLLVSSLAAAASLF